MRTVHGMKQQPVSTTINLIILIETGTELLSRIEKIHELKVSTGSIADKFISALEQECSFILIQSEMWDYFLHAEYKYKKDKFVDCTQLIDWNKWEMYRIYVDQEAEAASQEKKEEKQPHDKLADFYIFCPIAYKQMLVQASALPPIKEALKKIPGPVTAPTALAIEAINNLPDIGIALPGDNDKVSNPLQERGKLRDIFDKYAQWLAQQGSNRNIQEQQKYLQDALEAYEEKSTKLLGDNFLQCLEKICVLKTVKVTSDIPHLPRYNVYINGHGSSTVYTAQLEDLMAQAQRFGYWPMGKISSYDVGEVHKFKEARDAVKTTLDEESGYIAGLSPVIYGKTLDFFNGIANFVFVSTCYGAGTHLALPFVFMNAQSLSYTLITGALLDAESSSKSPSVTEESTQPNSYSVKSNIHFKEYFEGTGNFENFVRKEEQEIAASEKARGKQEPRNYFARLLNSVGNFLDEAGTMKKDYHIQNLPWIKLPGPTDWHVVMHMDNQVLVINDALLAAKKLEKKLKFKPSPRELQSDELVPWVSLPPELTAAWTEKWGAWEKKRKQPAFSSACIDAHNKTLIFVATAQTIIPTIEFGCPSSPVAIIPLHRPQSPSAPIIISFEAMRVGSAFASFFNYVLKPAEPLVKIPQKTLIVIKKIEYGTARDYVTDTKDQLITFIKSICPQLDAKKELSNCIVVFGADNMRSYDCYVSCDDHYFGIKHKIDRMIEIKEISLNEAFELAAKDWNAGLLGELMKLGAKSGPDARGDTALMKAAEVGSVAVVKKLIDAGVDLDAQNDFKETALIYAAEKNQLEVIKLLVEAGVKVNLQATSGWTALCKAVYNKNMPAITYLLDHGADPKLGITLVASAKDFQFIASRTTHTSPHFKKALQTTQQTCARELWRQQKTGGSQTARDIVTQQMQRMNIPKLIQETEAWLKA